MVENKSHQQKNSMGEIQNLISDNSCEKNEKGISSNNSDEDPFIINNHDSEDFDDFNDIDSNLTLSSFGCDANMENSRNDSFDSLKKFETFLSQLGTIEGSDFTTDSKFDTSPNNETKSRHRSHSPVFNKIHASDYLENFRQIFDFTLKLKKENIALKSQNVKCNEKNLELEKLKRLYKEQSELYNAEKNNTNKLTKNYNDLIKEYQLNLNQLEVQMQKNVLLVEEKERYRKFCFNIYKIFELSNDTDLSRATLQISSRDNDSRKILLAYKNIKNDYNNQISVNLESQKEIKICKDHINILKSEIDDKRNSEITKEQQILALRRQLEISSFCNRITSELVNQIQRSYSQVSSSQFHIQNMRKKLKYYENLLEESKLKYSDVKGQNEIINSLYRETFQELNRTKIEVLFLVESQKNLVSQLYSTQYSVSRFKLIKSNSLNSETTNHEHNYQLLNGKNGTKDSSSRYLTIISDLKKKISNLQLQLGENDLKNSADDFALVDTEGKGFKVIKQHSNDSIGSVTLRIKDYDIETLKNAHAELQAEVLSLHEDIETLKNEIVNKNKLIDSLLLQQVADSDLKDSIQDQSQKNVGFFDSFFSNVERVLTLNINEPPSDANKQINIHLKAQLEETLIKNIMLKENITTLGNEIERLNEKLISIEKK